MFGFPHTNKGFDSVCVVFDGLTKSAHILAGRTSMSLEKLAELCSHLLVCQAP